ncbi:MAG: LacI family repressor for deo operon, udp, cdd, tsx, nupC, and nupG [Lentisphaeria bacterium]|jgi:LacI family repressor for deo operon, udp, cdd, tsx, nupC, and nupG
MAIGATHHLKISGSSVPNGIFIFGFDKIEFASYMDPLLITIAQPSDELGRVAFSALLDLLEGAQPEKCDYVLSFELIVPA